MPQAAVPSYIGQDFQDTPPGHRFSLYFKVWEENWARVTNISPDLLKQATSLPPYAVDMAAHFRQRQRTVAVSLNETIFSLPATSISPFMTGTGMEHPLENGFAFLNPYGLPYLPGAGVKGVLRRAVENLACGDYGDAQGWSQQSIDALFGRETASGDSESARNRGALRFWDVFPEPANRRLHVEIMTPHYSDYYQGNSTPHDSGQPNPILFLTIPPGSRFEFFVQCDSALLPKSLRDSWKALLETAFRHAFEWLGFGAKTAVGYGQFPSAAIEQARTERERMAAECQAQTAQAALSPGQKTIAGLRRWFEEDQGAKRKEPGGRVANRLNELLREALAWPAAEREELAKLAETIYGYLDWGSGKKKQERKAKIQQLRENVTQ